MKDAIKALQHRFCRKWLREVMLYYPQAAMPSQTSQILPAAREEIVQNDHRVTSCEKALDKMAADESGATGYQTAHHLITITFHT